MSKFERIKQFLYNIRHLNSMASEVEYLRNELSAALAQQEHTAQELEKCEKYLEKVIEEYHSARSKEIERYAVYEARLEEANGAISEAMTGVLRRMQQITARLSIRVVFLCEQPSLWSSFRSVVSAMQNDSRFEVILVRLWCKRYASDGTYIFEGANFCEIEGEERMQLVDSYDERTGKWLNLEKLEPEYVFYMRPYDYYRHEDYHIKAVSAYAKTCYIPYGIPTNLEAVDRFSLPQDFCTQVNYFFAAAAGQVEMIKQYLGEPQNSAHHIEFCGYPPMDTIKEVLKTRNCNTTSKSKQFTILWLPRWNTREGICNFFEYKDLLPDYVMKHTGCHLIFRPHPMCFQDFLATGELTEEELALLRAQYEENTSLRIDEDGSYIPSFEESDVLVADPTSLIGEYMLTGKPVIFCKKPGKLTTLMELLMDGMYVTESYGELRDVLDLLRQGNDPLRDIRETLTEKYLDAGSIPAGVRIRNRLVNDYLQQMLEYR